jgi:peptide/nickel transport system permease protein
MIRTIGLKLAHLVPVMFLVSLATFFLIELVPGDAAAKVAGPNASREEYLQIREDLGLNKPLIDRYGDWIGNTLTGDFGEAITGPKRPVIDMIQTRLPITFQVAVMGLIMALAVAVPLALLASSRPGSFIDRFTTAGAFGSISLPGFLGGLILIFFFVFNQGIVQTLIAIGAAALLTGFVYRTVQTARHYPPGPHRSRYLARNVSIAGVGLLAVTGLIIAFPDFPRQGFERVTGENGLRENFRSAFLPALTLATTEAAVWMRLLRADLLATLQDDFILAARAKGMPRWRILLRDALRPSSFSLITIVGVSLGRAIGGTVIVESIFNLNGMGTMMVQAINGNDLPVVQTTVLIVAAFYVSVNACVDVAYAYLDPRIRRGRI